MFIKKNDGFETAIRTVSYSNKKCPKKSDCTFRSCGKSFPSESLVGQRREEEGDGWFHTSYITTKGSTICQADTNTDTIQSPSLGSQEWYGMTHSQWLSEKREEESVWVCQIVLKTLLKKNC